MLMFPKEDELRAACAHELSTCGTPLLIRSPTAENHAEHHAAQETLADMLHETPEPLPPAPAIWARQHQEEIGAHLKACKESTETPSPNTPDATPEKVRVEVMRKPRSARAKAKAYAGTGEKKRGGTSEYTGVWFDTRVRKWCTKLTTDPSTGRQIRLGAYQREDAAYAYAAGAFVIRRKDTFPKVMELTVGEMAALEGGLRMMCIISCINSSASSPEPNPPDAREGESFSSRGTATNRRKAGPSASVGDGRSARPVKRRKVSDVPDTEEQADAPPTEPEPESSDDDPNEALPRVNTAADDDAEETNGERSDSAPVMREEFDVMRKSQKDTVATLARLETALLASLANHTAKKRKRDNAGGGCETATNARKGRRVSTPEESKLDEDEVEEEHWRHIRSSSSPVLQRALKFLPSSKGWKASFSTSVSSCAGDLLPLPFASLALAADKARCSDLNRTLSNWKTAAAGRVHDTTQPKLGLFCDKRDARSPWAAPRARSAVRVRERLALTLDGEAFAACARAAFKPRMLNGTVTLKLYHMAWLEHVVADGIRYWETRKGRLSNSAGVNAQIVDGLRECALTDVIAAVDEFQPAYDATTSSWAWGHHGLRLSSCGIERQVTAAPAASESGREGDNLSLN
ncbi:unnamed protein product [Closterium sp. Yama58-4]|nr:unnamed protein product [Closterium sp. Yama58-4]